MTNETYRKIFDELAIEYQLRADGRIDNNFALRHDGTSLLSYLNFQDDLIYLAVNSRLGDHIDKSQWTFLEPEALTSKKVSGLVRAGKRYAVHPKAGQERQAIASLFGAFVGKTLGEAEKLTGPNCKQYCEVFDELGIEYELRVGHIDINTPLRYDGASLKTYVHYQRELDYLAIDPELDAYIDNNLWHRLGADKIRTERVAQAVHSGVSFAVYPINGKEHEAINSLFSAYLNSLPPRKALIQSVTIENFKGIGDAVTIPLRPITLLFGKNSAGKSTVLHALLYALEVLQSGNWDAGKTAIGGDAVDLGGFKNLVHRHETNRNVRLRFDLDLSGEKWTADPGQPANRRTFPIDEFLIDDGEFDQSGVGDEVESAWVELVIGCREGEYTGVAHIDIGYDGKLFARIGRFTRDALVYAPDAACRANLNILHPVFSQDTSHEYCSLGMSDWTFLSGHFRSYFRHEYFADWPFPEEYAPSTIEEVIALQGFDGTWKIHRDFDDFDHGTMRCTVFGDYPNDFDLVEMGATRDLGTLAVYRSFGGDFHNESCRELEFGTGDSPQLDNITEDGVPDWTKPFRTLSPTSDLRGVGIVDESIGKFNGADGARFVDQMLERLLYGPLVWLRDELASMCYLGPIRDVPDRNDMPPKTPVPGRWSTGLAAWDAIKKDPALLDRCSEALQRIGVNYELRREHVYHIDPDSDFYHVLQTFGTRIEEFDERDYNELILDYFESGFDIRVVLIDKKNELPVAPGDVGTGVAQVIPVIVGALDKNMTIFVVEQPELHVHPAVQCELGDLLISATRNARRLLLVETHSEHLVLRLLRRIRETDTSLVASENRLVPEDISINFVTSDDECTWISQLDIASNGDFLDPWPGGFFPERVQEVFGF